MNREEYEEDLRRKQREHLDGIKKSKDDNWRPCLHDSCSQCIGTGVKQDGSICIHMISCPCPKCSPHMMYQSDVNVIAVVPAKEWFKDQFEAGNVPFFIREDDYVVAKWHDFHDGQNSHIEGKQTIAICKSKQDAQRVYASNLQ